MKKIFVTVLFMLISFSCFAEQKYVLKFQLKQSHITLDLGKHLKDAMNKIEFEIPVDKEYFYSLKIGDKVVDKVRVGSAILYGSFGSWTMTVIDKKIIE